MVSTIKNQIAMLVAPMSPAMRPSRRVFSTLYMRFLPQAATNVRPRSSSSLPHTQCVGEFGRKRTVPFPHVRSHDHCGNQIPSSHAIPRERARESRLGQDRGEPVEPELEDHEENQKYGQDRRLLLRSVRDKRQDESDRKERDEVEDRVPDDPRRMDFARRGREVAGEDGTERRGREERLARDHVDEQEPESYGCRAERTGNDSFTDQSVLGVHVAFSLTLTTQCGASTGPRKTEARHARLDKAGMG